MSCARKEHIIRWFNVSGPFCDEVILGMKSKFLLVLKLKLWVLSCLAEEADHG